MFNRTPLALAGFIGALLVSGCSTLPDQADSSPRVDALIANMTLQEKISFLHGAEDPQHSGSAGYLPGVPRLGIPPLHLTDGPAGIRLPGRQATALPAPVALAATFSPALARQAGEVSGSEGRALGQDVLLSPMVNLVRVPQAGRNFETLGEDPVLASALVSEQIRGIQSQGMIATVKHFAANNQENARENLNASIDERTLHELYLPAFEAAVQAGTGSIMCAYNGVNGHHACENDELLNQILRQGWGFRGFVMSDWMATHSTAKAMQAGLDMEMPFGRFYGDALQTAVQSGEVKEAQIDNSVRRILMQMERFHLLDPVSRPALDPQAHAGVARQIALAGAVLLRNQQNMLPLQSHQLSQAALIGPTAIYPMIGGGGSSQVEAFNRQSPLDVLRERTGNAALQAVAGIHLDGEPIPMAALRSEARRAGLTYYGFKNGKPRKQGRIANLDLLGSKQLKANTPRIYRGQLIIKQAGRYDIKLQTRGGQGKLFIDGKPYIDTAALFGGHSLIPTQDGLFNTSVTLDLKAGKHKLELQANPGVTNVFLPPDPKSPMDLRLAWVTPQMRQAAMDEAVTAARQAADADSPALVFAYNEGTEGLDRQDLALPYDQDALIQAVAAVNPKTVVILNTGDPISMPWFEQTQAVLQMWYSGQEGAAATADLLLGVANPSGRLPVSFPASVADTPTTAAQAYPGINGQQTYQEGLLIGYRWYDHQQKPPRFPFGYGLSYTRFAYGPAQIQSNAAGGYRVSFTVTNQGKRAGADVPQLYLGAPQKTAVPMPPKVLVAFNRIELAPGESQEVSLTVPARALQFWSVQSHDWQPVPGLRPLYLGRSAQEVQVIGEVGHAE